jgi:hypothetical protein
MLKNYTHEKPKLFLAIDADNVSEFFYKKIKVFEGVALAPSLKGPQGCCATKED